MPRVNKIIGGRGTYANFDLVTSVTPKWFSENVRIRFTNSGLNDFLSDYSHVSQFKISAGATLIDGGSYANKFVANHSQFIAPVNCYLKSVNGYIGPQGGSGCGEETITISIWKKSVDVSGTSNTNIGLLFTQSFVFNGSSNQFTLEIDGSTDLNVNNPTNIKFNVAGKEGVLVSIKREAPNIDCSNFEASFQMVFEAIDSQSTADQFILESLATNTVNNGSGRRISSTINSASV